MRVYTFLLLIFFICCCFPESFAQDTINQKTVFVIDSIPRIVIEEDDQSLAMNEIHTYRRIGDKDSINHIFKLYGPDTLVFILTKLYMERADSLKHIPALSALYLKKDKYYFYKEDAVPYTGSYMETYLNGSKRFVGTIENGEINGYTSMFYPDGTLKYSVYYKHNKQDGIVEEYFPNGVLKRRGEMSDGKMNGIWRDWYSSGKLKEVTRYFMGQKTFMEFGADFYTAYLRAKASIDRQNYSDALGFLRDCIRIDENVDYIYLMQGTVYSLQNKHAKAIASYTKAIELEPQESSFYIARATATMRLIEENKENLSKLKNLAELRTSICDDYREAVSLGERTIPEAASMRSYCE